MSKDGNVRLCCRKATFFGMPIPAGGGRENNPSTGCVEDEDEETTTKEK
jgi:hypothetical protein